MPSRRPSRRPGPLLHRIAVWGFVIGLVAVVAAPAVAQELAVATGEKSKINGRITPAGDVDSFAIELFDGDRVKVKASETGPQRDLRVTLALFDPDQNEITTVDVKGQGGRSASFDFTATRDGIHVFTIRGDSGFDGAEGDYTLRTAIKRVKGEAAVLSGGADGGPISYDVNCPGGALLTLKAKTRRGGFDLTDLLDPSGTAEPDFGMALVAKSSRRSAKLKKFPVTGGAGTYEVVGAYDLGSTVKLKAKVTAGPATKNVKTTLDSLEPSFDLNFHRFPASGIEGSDFMVFGTNLGLADASGALTFPTFWIGAVLVPTETVEQLGQSVFRFPVPAGLTPDETYDVTVRNSDGQGAVAPDAFYFVPPPQVFAMTPTESGPAGGRELEITGLDFRGGSLVLFDGVVVQPKFVFETRIVVVAPAHAPGSVTLTLRDEHGQIAVVPETLTVLDIGSNEITSIEPAKLQAIGGELVRVHGVDFVADSELTLGGADLVETLDSNVRISFESPIHVPGDVVLRVEDQYMQSSTRTVEVTGLDDESDTVIPAPITTAGSVDGWRATRILRGLVDDDANEDLVLLRPATAFGSSANRSRVRILLGDGSGGFTDGTSGIPAVSTTDDWRAIDGVLFDYDDDGDLDLALVTADALDGGDRSSLRILENDGTGDFTDVTDTAFPEGETSWGDHNQGVALAAVDLTGDDVPELIVTHSRFFEETIITTPPPVEPPAPPPEPTIEVYFYAGTRVLLNDGSGVFSRDPDALPPVGEDDVLRFEGNALAVTDVDGDDDLDIFVTRDALLEDPDNASTYLRVGTLLRNDTVTDLVFTDASDTLLPAASDPEYLQCDRAYFHDTDGDGDDDLVIASNTKLLSAVTMQVVSSPSLRIFEWDGGAFGAAPNGTLPGADGDDQLQCEDIGFVDLDGDGDDDFVLVSNSAPNSLGRAGRVLRQNADDTFTRASAPLPNPLTADNARGVVVHVLDLDGDGDLDVVIGRDEPDESVRNTRAFVNGRP